MTQLPGKGPCNLKVCQLGSSVFLSLKQLSRLFTCLIFSQPVTDKKSYTCQVKGGWGRLLQNVLGLGVDNSRPPLLSVITNTSLPHLQTLLPQ